MKTVYGVLTDELGHAKNGGAIWATPAAEVRSVQEAKIPIDVDHSGAWVGEVVYLERRNGNLWCVGHVDDSVTAKVHVKVAGELVSLDHPLFWSATRIGGADYGIAITSVALTSTPARISPKPVVLLDGALDFRQVAKERWHLRDANLEILTRAANAHLDRRRTSPLEPLVVHGTTPKISDQAAWSERVSSTRRIEVRSATAVEVHHSRREVDLIIAPAESPTVIYERSGSFVETFAHGAFAGCEENPERVKVNMHHVRERTVGKALALEPWDEEGLTGTIKLARVQDADEALALIDDDLLGVSAGFAVDDKGIEWNGKHRRVRRALLDHIALTADPAYQSATVTAVRSSESRTPRLDAARAIQRDTALLTAAKHMEG